MDFLHSAIGQRRVKRIACRVFFFYCAKALTAAKMRRKIVFGATPFLLLAATALEQESWTQHKGKNCYSGHGGTDLDSGHGCGTMSVAARQVRASCAADSSTPMQWVLSKLRLFLYIK